jgi:ABC-type uncharacterized transport system substrate-binding protein
MTMTSGFAGFGRRRFIQGAAAVLLPFLAPLRSEAAIGERSIPRIGILGDSNPVGWFVRPAVVDIEYRWADERRERLPNLAAELVQLEVDIIIAVGPGAARAATNATGTVPIVFVATSDPILVGLVRDVGRPRGNLTGVVVASGVEMAAARLEVLRAMVPRFSRMAVLGNPENPGYDMAMRDVRDAAAARRVEVHSVTATNRGDLEGAFARMAHEKAGIVLSDVVFATEAWRIAALASAAGLPVVYETKSFVEAGGLMALHADGGAMIQRTVSIVQRILRGERPAAIPVEQLTRLELTINRHAADTLGLALPHSLLARADTVIGA